jgi:hypothetical protein
VHRREVPVTLAGAEMGSAELLPPEHLPRGQPWRELGLTDPGFYDATLYVAEAGVRHDTISTAFWFGEVIGDPRLDCSDLTQDFRAECPDGHDCYCIGNQYCQGFLADNPAWIDCAVAAEDCGAFCFFWDWMGVCDCARYCGMFVERLGCARRIDCADVMAEYLGSGYCERAPCGCVDPGFCDGLLAAAAQQPSCELVDLECAAHCAARDPDGACGCQYVYCGVLLEQVGCSAAALGR